MAKEKTLDDLQSEVVYQADALSRSSARVADLKRDLKEAEYLAACDREKHEQAVREMRRYVERASTQATERGVK